MQIKELFQDLQNKNDDLQFLASYDALTKLRNRRSMGKVMEQYEQDGTPYCMILGDIDDFKRINDTYGHTCGDIVLQKIAGDHTNFGGSVWCGMSMGWRGDFDFVTQYA